MSDQELVVAERPTQLLTIKPTEYVAQVFEPFARRLADAVKESKAATFDITTTIGKATATRQRAIFWAIQVEGKKAHKERKAPILEIGRLLDSRLKEIVEAAEPYRLQYDTAIKDDDKRKEDEKAAKAMIQKQRVDGIQALIRDFAEAPMRYFGSTSAVIIEKADWLAEQVIDLETYAEFLGEAVSARDDAVKSLRDLAEKALAAEQEAVRLAEERAQLERDRLAQAQAERAAAEARAKQEAKERAEREKQEAADRAVRAAEDKARKEALDRANAAMLAEQAAHAKKMKEQQDALDRERTLVEAERKRQADAEAARRRIEVEAAEAAQRVEQARIDRERREAEAAERAAQAEATRREQAQFEANGPEPTEILAIIAKRFNVEASTALYWMNLHVWAEVEVA